MKVVATAVFFLIGYVSSADDLSCSVCLPNGVNCISDREYKICRGQESPINGKVHTCSETQVCTEADAVCLEKVQPDGSEVNGKCEKTSLPTDEIEKLGACELCVEKYAYACIGPTIYALCMGAIGKGNFNPQATEECPQNYICNTATTEVFNTAIKYNPYYPCVPNCAVSIVIHC